YTYLWPDGSGGTSYQVGPDARGTSGSVTVEVTDGELCWDDDTLPYSVNDELVVTLTLESTDHCNGIVYFSALAEGGDGSYTYLWPDGSGGTSYQVGPDARGTSGSVTVEVTDGELCWDDDTLPYSINYELVASIARTVPDPCTGEIYFGASAVGGGGGYTYVFHNLPAGVTDHGDGTASGAIGSGSYSGIYVTATDANQCTDDSDPLSFDYFRPEPRLLLGKYIVEQTPHVIVFHISVTNGGNVPLTNVRVLDPPLGLDETIPVLAPGAFVEYELSYDLDDDVGIFCNEATAWADDVCDSPIGPLYAQACERQNRPPEAYDLELRTCRLGSEENPLGEWITFEIRATDPDLDPSVDPSHPTFHHLTFPADGLTALYGSVSGDVGNVTYSADGIASVTLHYVSPIDFVGEDIITFVVEDPYGAQDVGVVRIQVEECDPIPGGAAFEPIINEIQWTGTEFSEEHEWIELFNPLGGPIVLDGYTVAWRERRADVSEFPGGSLASYESWLRTLTLEEFILDAEVHGVEHHSVELNGEIGSRDYFLLERQVDETVSDLDADLVYEPELDDDLLLGDIRGEEVYLFNADGELVSTANTQYPTATGDVSGPVIRWLGWAAGGIVEDHWASMELIDPALLEGTDGIPAGIDQDEFWANNHGIFIYGVDAARDLLTATARYINEALILRLLLDEDYAPDPIVVIAGETTEVTVALRETEVEEEGYPQPLLFSVVPLHSDEPIRCPTLCIAVELLELLLVKVTEEVAPIAIVSCEDTETCRVTVDVTGLELGDYELFVTMGDGVVHGIPIVVISEEE
ncbi:MAG: hypothetical protein JSW65_08405, partial [Candidatus Bipolaricaulota bacterium]